MAAIAPDPTPTTHDTAARIGDWLRLLAWFTGVVAFVDLAFIALVGEVIPPLLAGVVLTGVGIALIRRFPRTATIVLGVISVLMLVGAVQFGVGDLAHPSSGIGFVHAFVGIFGRVAAIAVAVMALRRANGPGPRRVATAAVGMLAVSLLIAGVATVATSGEEAGPGDVVTAISGHAFADTIEVEDGGTLFVENQEPFRHTFTVENTSVDVVIPASQGVRIPIDLAPGSYPVICDIPGHEAMQATLIVR